MTRVDENYEYYALAFDGTNPQPLKVDPVTDRLMIDVTVLANSVSVLNDPKIDVNNESVSLVVDTNDAIRPLQSDNRNNYLYIDIVRE